MKKTFTKFGKILLIACLCLAMLPVSTLTAYAASNEIVILYTANLRGNIDVLPQVAQLKAEYAANGTKVILADAGNFLQGTVYATHDSGETLVSLMDAAGYDIVTIGSHEFDFGTGKIGVEQHGVIYQDGTLGKFLDDAAFTAVNANILAKGEDGSETNAYNPSFIITTKDGLKLGFFGLTDPDTANQVLESNLTGLAFADPAAAAAAQKAALSACDLTVCLSNAGTLPASTADVVIDVADDAGFKVGKITLDSAGKVVSSETITLSGVSAKEDVKTAVDTYKAIVDEAYPSIAKSEVTLNGSNSAVRSRETNLGNLWTDALRWFAVEGGIADYYDEDDINAGNTGIAVDADHVVAVWNGGNLRDYLNPGDVVMKDLQRVLPYPNSVAVIYLTGAQLLEMLESATQALPWAADTNAACAAFLQVSGLKYTAAANKAYDAGEAYGNNWFRANSINRVNITEVNGKPLDLNATYAVIASNAIYNGMDSNYICTEKDPDLSAITSATVRDVVWLFIQNKLSGVIGGEYAQPQGRITVLLSGAPLPFTDVSADAWYHDAVQYCYDNSITSGTSATTFEPDAKTTRAMFVRLLANIDKADLSSYIATGFTDVQINSWYGPAVAWAADKGLVLGEGNNQFNPNGLITREQMAVILTNYLKYKGMTFETEPRTEFTDIGQVSDWALASVKLIADYGIIQGSDGQFKPKDNASRAKVVQLLMNFLQK